MWSSLEAIGFLKVVYNSKISFAFSQHSEFIASPYPNEPPYQAMSSIEVRE